MKRYALGFLFIAIAAASCLKSKETENICDTYDPCKFVAPAAEITQVENYLAAQGITGAVKHCSGVYYKIVNEGSGAKPGVCSAITVNYKGRLTNGTVFDSTAANIPYTEYLINLIAGWKNTLPLLKNNGSIQLFIPPSLGYGAATLTKVPANSMLIFDVDLLNIQ